jgi:conjugative transfer region protein (TIGR03748 family)
MKRKFIAIILVTMLFGKACLANDITQTGRYTTINNKPKISQTDLLSQTIQLRFTRNILTVGDAMNLLLKFSGYSLVSESQMCPEFKITLNKPLPLVDRELGPVTLREGLTTLAGSPFYLISDPVNRTINFTLKSEYLKFIKHNQSNRG